MLKTETIKIGTLEISITKDAIDIVSFRVYDTEEEVEVTHLLDYDQLKDLIKFFWENYIELKKERDKHKGDQNNTTQIIKLEHPEEK